MPLFRHATKNGYVEGQLPDEPGGDAYLDHLHAKEKGSGTGRLLLGLFEAAARFVGAKKILGILGSYEDTNDLALKQFCEKYGYYVDESNPEFKTFLKEL